MMINHIHAEKQNGQMNLNLTLTGHMFNFWTTVCQLTIPNAAKADFADYYCQVKLELAPQASRRNCYLLSEIISSSEAALISDVDVTFTSENNFSSIAISTAVPVTIATIILLTVASATVIRIVRCYHHSTARHHDNVNNQAEGDDIPLQEGHYQPPPHILPRIYNIFILL